MNTVESLIPSTKKEKRRKQLPLSAFPLGEQEVASLEVDCQPDYLHIPPSTELNDQVRSLLGLASPDDGTTSLDQGSKLSSDNALLERFRAWKKKTKTRAIVLQNKGDSSKTKVIPVRYSSRFFDEGAKAQKMRLLAGLSKEKKFGVLMTLTVDPKEFDHDSLRAVSAIWTRHKTFKDALNMRLSRKGFKKLRALTVLEFTKKGWPHLHLWCPGRHYIAPQKELQELWGAIVDLRRVSSAASRYVVKYVTKLHKLPERDQAQLWNRRTRTYTIAKDFRIKKNRSVLPPQWELVGTIWGRQVGAAPRDPRLTDLVGAGPPLQFRGIDERMDYELGALLEAAYDHVNG